MRSVPLAFLLLVACRPATTPAASSATHALQQPSTTAPADVSHGEAPIGTTAAPADIDPAAPARSTSHLHKIRFEMKEAHIQVTPQVTYAAWSFEGRVPGPVLRVTQGDTVDFTLVNKTMMAHSMDFHAAEVAPSRVYTNVMPNDSLHYRWVAQVPGVFMYHCGTAPVAMHIANGMYGALIVDPVRPRPAAHEIVLVQSEFYEMAGAGKDSAVMGLDWPKLLSLAPDQVVFNGRASQYATHPITVKAGELVRLYVVDAGPNRASSFHVVGAIFDRVFEDARATPTLEGVQTVQVPVGGGAIFEVRLTEPGNYPFVSHAFADATKGAVGILKAE